MNPRIGVAVFLMENDKFVMLERQGSHGAGTWSVPGGAMEFGEHWLDTGVREVQEEVGVVPYDLELLTITNDIMYDQHWVTIWLTAKLYGQQPRNLEPHKAKQLTWASFDNLPEPLFGPWEHLFDTVEFKSWAG
jgi:8-oxo-dGTP diphosphatase